MADSKLADKWLKENGLTWSGKRPGEPNRKVKQRQRPMFYCEHDVRAYQALRRAEMKRPGRTIKVGESATAYGMDFLKENLSADSVDCIYMPHHKDGVSSVSFVSNRPMAAYRAMCIMAHGLPESEDMVARHLCGNGHFHCVNPAHLKWGTQEENAQDRVLHRVAPRHFREIGQEEADKIKKDPRHPNVIAIDLQIPSQIILMVQAGTYRQWR